ncbi:SufS family cysteine desulfurase [Novipirellula artificiosorum]|uniref:Cysteine desulfurase n=1 Tax=Novipirellula artificiosorum TaxID=2528016 RepID=A0A5C6DH63_9BACT|nr:SufS family cysteine desulfurase [Novipirellula artificiosorum]TWU35091.1 putative cysteine desulfurase [Novipirellula artificiosorum]
MNAPNPAVSSVFDVDRYRRDFPILTRKVNGDRPLAFLDNAASSQRPTAVVKSMSQFYENCYANVHRGIHTLSEESTDLYEQARRGVARFLNAAEDKQVIFTAGCTAAINTVARTWGDVNLSSSDTILLTIAEHHANIVPWHQLAERTGCRIEFLPINDQFEIPDEVVIEHLDRLKPRLFAFTAASNTLGTEFPVQRWTQWAQAAGATVLVDAAQSAPHLPTDVQAWGVDFLAFSGHKVCGPTGIGVLYGKTDLLDSMPAFLGGGGMINKVTTAGFTSAALPDKFEAGTPPIAEAVGLCTATEYVSAIGLDAIHRYECELGGYADRRLREIEGVRVIGPTPEKKAGIVSFVVDHVHAHDLAQSLDGYGIAVRAGHHCTMPLHESIGIAASTRASFYFYNTFEEADRLIEAVAAIRKRFAPTGRKRRRS